MSQNGIANMLLKEDWLMTGDKHMENCLLPIGNFPEG